MTLTGKMKMTKEITTSQSQPLGMFEDLTDMTCFDNAQRMAKAIKAKPLYKNLRKAQYKTTVIETTKDNKANDRFLMLEPLLLILPSNLKKTSLLYADF